MIWFIEVLSYWEAHAVLSYCAPVIVKSRSEFGASFSDVGDVRAFCANETVQNIARVAIVIGQIDCVTRAETYGFIRDNVWANLTTWFTAGLVTSGLGCSQELALHKKFFQVGWLPLRM